ncbi:MAG: hypothetical protein IJ980_05565 [Oscillospiraceae bacterium]|nr:hypothetical protein [Oscillospiraceae bacterium]MBR2929032.1 hypothetical protein [Oscillospiraceae bacterium]
METTEAPPVADKARLFRGSGTIGGHEVSANRHAATVFKEKEIVLAACQSLGQKTNCGTCVGAECLSICSAFLFAAADAEFFDHCHGSGSGKRSRSIRDAASLAKAKYVVRGSVCRYAPIAFSFSSVPSTAHLLFLPQEKEKEDVGLKFACTCESARLSVSKETLRWQKAKTQRSCNDFCACYCAVYS